MFFPVFSCLVLVPTGASSSCSCLTEVKPDMVFCLKVQCIVYSKIFFAQHKCTGNLSYYNLFVSSNQSAHCLLTPLINKALVSTEMQFTAEKFTANSRYCCMWKSQETVGIEILITPNVCTNTRHFLTCTSSSHNISHILDSSVYRTLFQLASDFSMPCLGKFRWAVQQCIPSCYRTMHTAHV